MFLDLENVGPGGVRFDLRGHSRSLEVAFVFLDFDPPSNAGNPASYYIYILNFMTEMSKNDFLN